MKAGDAPTAEKAWAPVRERIAKGSPPQWVYRAKLASWEQAHTLPAVERRLLQRFASR